MEVSIHSNLNPLIFDSEKKLKPQIKNLLLDISRKVLEDLDEKITVKDIVLTGSMANYTYTDQSDLDLHIIFDFKEINDDIKLVKKALDCNKFVWNIRHDIFIKEHEVELYYQDANEPHAATGMYSLMTDGWVKEPSMPSLSEIKVDKQLVVKKIRGYISFIKMLKNEVKRDLTKDYASKLNSKAGRLLTKIKEERKEGLDEEGEFSEKNLVFKYLRNHGYIDELIDITMETYDKALSESIQEQKMRHMNAVRSGITRKKHPEFVPDMHKLDPKSFTKLEALKKQQKGRLVLSPFEFKELKRRYNIDLIIPGKFKMLGNTGIKVYFDVNLNRHIMEK
jgi:predicted nucleotidyltransferase